MGEKRLTKDEEHLLIALAQKGDLDAKEKLIHHYEDFIHRFANHYLKKGIEYEDLFQVVLLGLIDAINNFDLSHDVYLSTFAPYWIKKNVNIYLNTCNPMGISDWDFSILKRFSDLEHAFSVQGVSPSLDDYAGKLGVSKKRVLDLILLHQETISMNSPVDEDGTEYYSFIESKDLSLEETIVYKDLKERIRVLFYRAKLKPDHISILNLRYGLTGRKPMTLEEIARELHKKYESVRQLEVRALKRIRLAEICMDFLEYADNQTTAEQALIAFREHYKKPNAKLVKKLSHIKEG